MKKLNAVSFGVGVIGSLTAKFILEEKGDVMDLVGAYDIDPKKVGKDLGTVVDLGRSTGVKVADDLGGILTKDIDVVIHTTTSYLKAAVPQIEEILAHGVDVVSSCEELSYPYVVDRKLASRLDLAAKRHGASVLGTGINPGFLMDALPIMLSAPCKSIDRITVTRRMDAASRRIPFQKKVGVGMTTAQFSRAIDSGLLTGHVGLGQSASMLADAIGWDLDGVEVDGVEPVVAKSAVHGYVSVPAGRVTGVRQSARGIIGGKPVIQLNFMAYVGSEEYDKVEIEGVPPVNCKISPCIHGDHGTVAMLVNMAPKVVASPPGLLTMKDVVLPSAFL